MSSLLDRVYDLIEEENRLSIDGVNYVRIEYKDCLQCDLLNSNCLDVKCIEGEKDKKFYVFKKVEG
jgi:hypothetical protein